MSASTADPLTIEEDTGVTFPGEAVPASSSGQLTLVRKKLGVAKYLLLPLGGLILASILGNQAYVDPVLRLVGGVSVLALLLAWPFPMIRAVMRTRRGTKLGDILEAKLAKLTPLTEQEETGLRRAIQDHRISDNDREYQTRIAYLHLIQNAVADGSLSKEEVALLRQVEALCGLDPDFRKAARLDVFRTLVLEVVADHDLTEAEDAVLKHVQSALEITDDDISIERTFVDQLREIRAIRSGRLPHVTPSKPLSKDEPCHYEGPVRLLKTRIIRSFQREGQKYKVRGLVVDKEGTLLITNQRLLIVHEGATSIPLKRILDLHLDYDRNLLAITKDGSTEPIYLTTPDAHRATAIVASMAGL